MVRYAKRMEQLTNSDIGDLLKLIARPDIISVSYTHLDVYKRQRHFLFGNVVPFDLFRTQQYRRQNFRQRFHGVMYFFFGIGLGTHFNEGRPWQHMQAEAIGIEIDFPIEFGKSCR